MYHQQNRYGGSFNEKQLCEKTEINVDKEVSHNLLEKLIYFLSVFDLMLMPVK